MTENTLAIQALYVAYFNRPADPRGLAYYETVVAANNGDTSAISADFAKSAEYKAAYANLDNFSIVAQVYQNLFGRAGDLPGVNYWTALLDNGSVTIDNVVAQISKGALTTDAEIIENRAAGAAKFTEALDTVEEIVAYNGAAANGIGKSFLSTITTDASLATATTAAALTAVTNQVLGTLPSTTTNLTAGIDSLTGTSGNDVFNAYATGVLADGSDATTLGSNDVIDGGAGNDTLNIEAIDGKNETQAGTVRNVETINIINNGGLFGGADGVDASKFIGATAIWQVGTTANSVNNVAASTTVGFRGTSTNAGALAVEGAAASVSVALDGVTGFTTNDPLTSINEINRVTLNVEGDSLNTVTVSGAMGKAVSTGAAAALDLNVTAGTDANGTTLSTITVNTAVKTTLTIDESVGAEGAVKVVNAAGSTGAVTFVADDDVTTITGGSAADTLTLATVFSASAKAATIDGGAGNDKITVTANNGANITGTSVTANGGDGNDTITVKVTNGSSRNVDITVNGGAGDDTVIVQDETGAARGLTDNDHITGGDGVDTIVVGAAAGSLDSGDYVRLQDLSGFEQVKFATALADVDASELAKFTQIEFAAASNVTDVAATQKIVTAAALTLETTGYNADATDHNNSAAAATLSVVATAAVEVNAKSVALTVDTTVAAANVVATLTGDLDTATANLVSTTNTAGTADYIASLTADAATFTSLIVTGTGSVNVDNTDSAKLTNIDTSGLKGTDVNGDAFVGLTFTGNADLAETIKLGTGEDFLTINSLAGSTSLSKMDTITGFDLEVDHLAIEGHTFASVEDIAIRTFSTAPASLGAALNTVSALDAANVVFQFAGNTYIFIDAGGADSAGNFEAGDTVIKLTGAYDLDDLATALVAGIPA